MKINKKLLSLPPYISTSWRDVQSLHQKDEILFVSLINGDSIQIPNLSPQIVNAIFSAHAMFLEEEAQEESRLASEITNPVHLSMSPIINMLQHDIAQANAPNLPQEVLQKVTEMAKLLLPEDSDQLPKAEPHCNCMYCQVARAMSGIPSPEPVAESQEFDSNEAVEEKELAFQQWDVQQTDDKLFSVINRLDKEEHYSVFLGNPMGCTCGKPNCEHLIAVLQS